LRLIGVADLALLDLLIDADLEFVLRGDAAHDGAHGGLVPAAVLQVRSSSSRLAARPAG
jgi:hypothetical protein